MTDQQTRSGFTARQTLFGLLGLLLLVLIAAFLWNYQRQQESKPAAYGMNLALPALGGKLESAGSSSVALQERVYSFHKQREALINAIVINGSSSEILSDPTRMPKEVSILVSTTSASDGFSRIATATLKQVIGEQSISFSPTKAKYVKVRFLSTYGGNFADVREIKISEASQGAASIVADEVLNLVAADLGGEIESITGEYGPGYDGRLLINARPDTVWRAKANSFPQEIVLSFFNRQPALISSIEITPTTNGAASAKDVEIWTSMQGPADGFTQTAASSLNPGPGTQTISFSPLEARFVKVRILSTAQGQPLEIGQIRMPEAQAAGYIPLASRNHEILSWNHRPTQAAQWGIDWLQPASMDWQTRNQCFGCHSQAQVIMGLAVAKKNKYVVSDDVLKQLAAFMAAHPDSRVTAVQFESMALANFDDLAGTPDPPLAQAAAWLAGQQQPSGEVPIDHTEPPIDQGSLMTTANSVVAFEHVFHETRDARLQEAAQRSLSWIASTDPQTTQDKAFKIMVLSWFGDAAQQVLVQKLVDQLKKEQNSDGGWQEVKEVKGSNAFSTGQVLYAFKQAKVSVESPEFLRGVQFLLATQKESGAWPSFNSQSGRPSDYAPTMWAVIGLAGSFREKTGSLQIVSDTPEVKRQIGKNIEIVLDLSGSMNLPLGNSTRIATARDVLRAVLQKLPPDSNVGLRLYGHRFPSLSKQTCTDTELVLPMQRLNVDDLLAQAGKYKPRGDTALVYSVLQTPDDLKQLGGGSVILITDGEEDCHGDPAAASRQLKASGIDVTLDIVGFTVKGKEVEDQLKGFAESTGGRFYSAEDGDALARSLQAAAVRFPYKVFDLAGRNVSAGQADGPPSDLPPGDYKVTIYTAGEEILSRQVTIAPGKDLVLKLATQGGAVSIAP